MGQAQRVSIATYGVGAYRLTVLDCAECGEVFGIREATDQLLRRTGRTLYCPNGHSNAYPRGESFQDRALKEARARADTAEREAAEARRLREWAEARAKGANIQAGKDRAAMKRLRHRVECGVCPHCQRTFKQLAAHMHAKHADKVKGTK